MELQQMTDSELMTYLRDAIEMQDSKLYKRIQKEINRRNKNE